VYSKIRSQGAYSVDAWSGPAEPLGKPAPYDRQDIGASLIATLLLSLGLWAGIWAAVAFMASVVLG
jgi:hypothetical protein